MIVMKQKDVTKESFIALSVEEMRILEYNYLR